MGQGAQDWCTGMTLRDGMGSQTAACLWPLQLQPWEGPAVGRVHLCLVPQVRELRLPFLLRSVLTVT